MPGSHLQARLRETYGRTTGKDPVFGDHGGIKKIAKHDGIPLPFLSLVNGSTARKD